ncbi:MAG: hypothetical protein GY805_10900 [Chloroflexi bacterium]|nr:hypothetical protein [Chloroflexota bacterium]
MPQQVDQVYQSFLIRCWLIPPATNDALPIWRFELQEVSAEPQKHRFGSFEQLEAFVSAQLTAVAANHKREGDEN